MKIISRDQARGAGEQKFFTGLPCKYGHIAERYVKTGRCCQCNIEKCKKWKAANGDIKRELDRKYREENRQALSDYKKHWYLRNKESALVRINTWVRANRETVRGYKSRYRKRNPDEVVRHAARRRAIQKKAIPIWAGEFDELVDREATKLAQLRKNATGCVWHIDHMIPIQAKNACGLHIGINLQVVPDYINYFKNRKMILTQPDEWLKLL